MDKDLLEVARRFEALLDYEFRDTLGKDPARLGAAVMSSVARERSKVNEPIAAIERAARAGRVPLSMKNKYWRMYARHA